MILKDFLDLYSAGSSKMEIRSAYNDKLLCKKYPDQKRAALLERDVVMFQTEIDCSNNLAWPVLVVYLHGDVELEEDMKKRRAQSDASN